MNVIGFKPQGTFSIEGTVKPKIIITDVALQKMSLYVSEVEDEIGWLGSVRKVNDTYTIEDVYLFDQEVHATTCELDEQTIASWAESILINDPNGLEIVNSVRLWGHSHVRMQVSPSSQDNTQLLELGKNATDYYIRLIANKNGDMRVDFYDVPRGIIYNCLAWQRQQFLAVDEIGIKAEIKAKVKKMATRIGIGSGTTRYYTCNDDDSYTGYTPDYDTNRAGKKNKKNKKNKQVESLFWAKKAEDLIDEWGFSEDNVIECANIISIQNVMIYIDTITDTRSTFYEAEYVQELCVAYVDKLFNEESAR